MFSDESGLLLQFLVALGVVLILILLLAWVLKKVNAISSRVGREGADPRLSVREAIQVDHKRRLVLIRRDNIEHLVLIGGENDLLVEHHIPPMPHAPQQPVPQQPGTMHPAPMQPAPQQPAPQQPAPMRPAPQRSAPANPTPTAAAAATQGGLGTEASKSAPTTPAPSIRDAATDTAKAPALDPSIKAAVSDLTAQPATKSVSPQSAAAPTASKAPTPPSAPSTPPAHQEQPSPHALRTDPKPAGPNLSRPRPESDETIKGFEQTTPAQPSRSTPPVGSKAPSEADRKPEGTVASGKQSDATEVPSQTHEGQSTPPSQRTAPDIVPEKPEKTEDVTETRTEAKTEKTANDPAPKAPSGDPGPEQKPQSDAPAVEVTPAGAPPSQVPESYEDEINRLLNELTTDPKKS